MKKILLGSIAFAAIIIIIYFFNSERQTQPQKDSIAYDDCGTATFYPNEENKPINYVPDETSVKTCLNNHLIACAPAKYVEYLLDNSSTLSEYIDGLDGQNCIWKYKVEPVPTVSGKNSVRCAIPKKYIADEYQLFIKNGNPEKFHDLFFIFGLGGAWAILNNHHPGATAAIPDSWSCSNTLW
jgi:hypothetical protein